MPDVSGVLSTLPGVLRIVNVILLLSTLFFFTGTLSSHLIEFAVGLMNSRGRQLRKRLELALGKPAAEEFYDNPIIRSLSTQSTLARHQQIYPPSYIEPDVFARVIAALSSASGSALSASPVIREVKSKLVKPGEDLEAKLIEWFKAVNDRQAGVYTRWTFLRLLVVGLLLAGMMDIDTVHIAGTLWNNPEQAQKAAGALHGVKKVSANIADKSAPLTAADKRELEDAVGAAYTQLLAVAPPSYA